jgi:hypothetical protein
MMNKMAVMMTMTDKIENTQKRPLLAWIIITIVSFFSGIYAMAYFDLNSFHGGLFMVSLLFFVTGIVCIFIFYRRYVALDHAIKNHDIIAQWKYSRKDWADFLEWEYVFRKKENKQKFWLLTAVTVSIMVVFILVIPEAKLEMFFVLLGLLAFYLVLAFFLPSIIQHLRASKDASVLIIDKGVLFNRSYHTWDFPLSKLEKVKLMEKPSIHIRLVYGFFDRLGPRSYTLNIPVPRGRKADASKVIKRLLEKNKKR